MIGEVPGLPVLPRKPLILRAIAQEKVEHDDIEDERLRHFRRLCGIADVVDHPGLKPKRGVLEVTATGTGIADHVLPPEFSDVVQLLYHGKEQLSMRYRVFFTLPEGGEGTIDYNATDPERFRLLGAEAINRRRELWLSAHPGVRMRSKWFKMQMIMEVDTGDIVYPAAGRRLSTNC